MQHKFILIAMIFILSFVNIVASQTKKNNWFIFSPLNKSFMVELPEKPIRRSRLDPNDPDWEAKDIFECAKSVDVYSVSLESKDEVMAILVFDVSGKCKNTKVTFDNEAELLGKVLGPDEKEIIKNVKLKINQQSARDAVYISGNGYGRNLIVNGNKRIFLLSYGREDDKTPSKEAERIFRTFKPKKAK